MFIDNVVVRTMIVIVIITIIIAIDLKLTCMHDSVIVLSYCSHGDSIVQYNSHDNIYRDGNFYEVIRLDHNLTILNYCDSKYLEIDNNY